MTPGAVKLFDRGAAGNAMLEKKVRASSRWAVVLVLLTVVSSAFGAINLTPAETRRIGNRIWQNECGGTVSGLTSWNAGENFASLGIGHFIWYPNGVRGPFDESFPKFLGFIGDRQVDVPVWIQHLSAESGCPWNSRSEFLRDKDSRKMKELREFLARTVDLQGEFLVRRLDQALPKMLAESGSANKAQVRQQFDRVAGTAMGCYALVDYVNFKGEGVLATERYAGQGWGLLQVLEGMTGENNGPSAVKSFAESAKTVLKNRVRNSPPARNEARWLPGWLKRVDTYVGG
jgi:hypothetical protein